MAPFIPAAHLLSFVHPAWCNGFHEKKPAPKCQDATITGFQDSAAGRSCLAAAQIKVSEGSDAAFH